MQGAPYDQASVTSTLQASGCSVQSSRRQYLAQPLTANVKRARGGTPLGPCTPHTQEAAAVLAGGRWRRSGSARCGSVGALRTWPCLRAQVIVRSTRAFACHTAPAYVPVCAEQRLCNKHICAVAVVLLCSAALRASLLLLTAIRARRLCVHGRS